MTPATVIPEAELSPEPPGSSRWIPVLSVVVGVLLGFSALGLATVGQTEADKPESIAAAARAAYTESTSARVLLTQTIEVGDQTVTVRGEQLMDIANGRMSATFDMPLEMGRLSMVQDHLTFYARLDHTKTSTGAPGWIKVVVESAEGVPGLSQAATADPLDLLGNLAEAGIPAERVGTDEIDGHPVTQHRVTLTAPQILKQLGEADREAVEDSGVDVERISSQNDIWISADGLPRRIEAKADMDELTMTMRLDFVEYDMPVDVQIPAAGSIVKERTVKGMTEFGKVFADLGMGGPQRMTD